MQFLVLFLSVVFVAFSIAAPTSGQNLVPNADFDTNTAQWLPATTWDSDDSTGSPFSGSADHPDGFLEAGLLSACTLLNLPQPTEMYLSFDYRLSSTDPMVCDNSFVVAASTADCDPDNSVFYTVDYSRANTPQCGLVADTAWHTFYGPIARREGAPALVDGASLRLVAGLNLSVDSLDLHFDRIRLIPLLFMDGFESGLTPWSSSQP